MGDNVAAAAASSSSPEARIDAGGRRAEERVVGTMVMKMEMAGGVCRTMVDAAAGELDDTMEEGVGGAIDDGAMEEDAEDEV